LPLLSSQLEEHKEKKREVRRWDKLRFCSWIVTVFVSHLKPLQDLLFWFFPLSHAFSHCSWWRCYGWVDQDDKMSTGKDRLQGEGEMQDKS
jgi:hypothetical protein